jgi:hypothetical protein
MSSTTPAEGLSSHLCSCSTDLVDLNDGVDLPDLFDLIFDGVHVVNLATMTPNLTATIPISILTIITITTTIHITTTILITITITPPHPLHPHLTPPTPSTISTTPQPPTPIDLSPEVPPV